MANTVTVKKTYNLGNGNIYVCQVVGDGSASTFVAPCGLVDAAWNSDFGTGTGTQRSVVTISGNVVTISGTIASTKYQTFCVLGTS